MTDHFLATSWLLCDSFSVVGRSTTVWLGYILNPVMTDQHGRFRCMDYIVTPLVLPEGIWFGVNMVWMAGREKGGQSGFGRTLVTI